ncbi:hypothetical protein Q8A73_010347 [Channa argus]|nr:hypothetical protein Q8A73_010347 [Channa argus]
MGMADPMLALKVDRQNLPFLVDTGAIHSTLWRPATSTDFYKNSDSGFSGVPTQPLTKPSQELIVEEQEKAAPQEKSVWKQSGGENIACSETQGQGRHLVSLEYNNAR